jgi:hypothetical protein
MLVIILKKKINLLTKWSNISDASHLSSFLPDNIKIAQLIFSIRISVFFEDFLSSSIIMRAACKSPFNTGKIVLKVSVNKELNYFHKSKKKYLQTK